MNLAPVHSKNESLRQAIELGNPGEAQYLVGGGYTSCRWPKI